MNYHNPASSLFDVLSRGLSERPDQVCQAVWRKLLAADGDAEFLSRLAELMALPRQISALLQAGFPRQISAMSGWAPYLENGFLNQQLTGQWQSFIVHVPPHSLASLSLTAELLNTKFVTSDISRDELKRLIDMLSSFVVEVDAAALPPELKAYLARELNELQHRLRSYGISGALPVLRQVESMVGHCVVDPQYRSFLTSHELGRRLLNSLEAMAAVVTIAVGLPELSQSISQLLLR